MFNFLKGRRRLIFLLVVIIALFFTITAQTRENRSENLLSAAVQVVSYPFQKTSSFIFQTFQEIWSNYFWLIEVREENKRLNAKLFQLDEENRKNREFLIAYKGLQAYLGLKQNNPDQKVFASVIGEIKNGFSNLLIIDKGYNDGIRKNFAVTTPEGIVGKIQSTTEVQSVIQLISDSRSSFPVLTQRTRTKGILQGSFDRTLTLSYIPRRKGIVLNDNIVSSGLAGIFPKGFSVGKVSKIIKENSGLFQTVIIEPSVDLERIEVVAVILKTYSNIHTPLFTEKNERD